MQAQLTKSLNHLTIHNNFSASSFQNVDSSDLESTGYKSTTFSGKKKQMSEVMDELDKLGFIPEAIIESETTWFYENLGIDDTYFAFESVSSIVSHILALYSAKVDAFARGLTDKPFLHHRREQEDHAVYFDAAGDSEEFEHEIDDKYLDSPATDLDVAYRMESFNSVLPSGDKVKCQFVYKCQFSTDHDADDYSIESLGDKTFLSTASKHTKTLYSEILNELIQTQGPIIKHFTVASTGEQRIIIGYTRGTSPRYSSALTTLANYYKVNLKRKYVENFSNGFTIISMYIEHTDAASPEMTIYQIAKEASLLYCIPNNIFYHKFATGEMSIQECIYAHCGVIFVTHFLNRLGPEFTSLKSLLSSSNSPQSVELISRIKKRLTSETYTQSYIAECFESNFQLISQLYRHFVDTHYVSHSMERTLSYQRVSQIDPITNDEEFEKALNKSCSTNDGFMLVLRALYTFNKSILKTNFFVTSKIALSFRLDASFLPTDEYPNTPYGMFFVVGSDFRGFHIRFRDVARGGIRIVKSRSVDNYNVNMRTMFDENYNLASTQQKKNKDIPEGGSKGVILLNPGAAQERQFECFAKYIDSLLDLLIKDPKKESIVDLYNKPEMLYMGPDENTAGYVDWATLHAKSRGANLGFPWKAFFTGKSPSIGGIPHDEYGMTSLSVRAYTESIYKKLGIDDWSQITKLQMAGGDGDLGSNEIKLSGDETYVGLVDGFGVIVDEDGIDKTELIRLANERKGNDQFDRSKLGPKGYAIMIEDVDVKLPNGDIIPSGINFRNNFHLTLQKTYPPNFLKLFVPCGGRPNSLNATNVYNLIDSKTGKSIVPFIVEGANLFITQSAKLILEDAGAIVFKDASTNKGGVTSSSLEVLAALSFDDDGFHKHMCVDEETGSVPEFYKRYVKEVQSIVVRNAKNEFEMLWTLKESTGKPFSILSDELSVSINKLADELSSSKELWNDDVEFRNNVLIDALPQVLLYQININDILERVPIAYLRAIFATRLASEFVYTKGIDTNPAKFLEFISSLKKRFLQK
ncbi:hypothetical protein CANARDRAFT_194948 [[Candida] arabinofermentans NRRL YB-2248]|uniref:NAD-specific glutamate dehydrogenase n=1 Tax=[Candida] arabinofermentans NRRL YB-2248 TaxID=983967 RepID=A0A1E4T6A4_9ASCO|nr:hypothetical protein CANARDRAFT_194948 [[Candida] arabinofermentans NRRL YB-2248]